jgi:glutamate dehydrogenase
MNDGTQPEQEELLAQLQTQAAADTPPAERKAFTAFVRAYFETVALDILRARTPEELIRTARAHFALCQARQPGQTRVQVLPPRDNAGLAAVQTCTEDKPFLVDTLHLCIRNLGVPVDWTVHPILSVQRKPGGAYAGLGAKGQAESLVHVEFEALPEDGAYPRLQAQIQGVLEDLTQVVRDFPAMRERLQTLAASLEQAPAGADAAEFDEARAFLRWLDDSHFTFLGYTEAQVRSGPEGRPHFVTDATSALGLSRQGGRFADPDELIAPRAEMDKYADSTRLVVVTKANHRSPLHHPDYMDVISVKRFAPDGSVAGTCRFLGLFTTDTYTERPRHIPLIRRKAEYVMQRSRLPEHSHSGKSLRDTMHLLPRDELWQSSEEELYQTCMGIQSLRDRHQLKLFMRRDRYGRFYSCLVYLPRDRYSREVRDRIEQELMQVCNGQSV